MDNSPAMTKDVKFPVMPTDFDDDGLNMFAQAINWQNETVAQTHAMVRELWEVFAQLKPLLGAMPMMGGKLPLPPGIVLPGMPVKR